MGCKKQHTSGAIMTIRSSPGQNLHGFRGDSATRREKKTGKNLKNLGEGPVDSLILGKFSWDTSVVNHFSLCFLQTIEVYWNFLDGIPAWMQHIRGECCHGRIPEIFAQWWDHFRTWGVRFAWGNGPLIWIWVILGPQPRMSRFCCLRWYSQ